MRGNLQSTFHSLVDLQGAIDGDLDEHRSRIVP
jgi:hypothetical protein